MLGLYDAVALGMLAYSRAAFRVTTLAPARLRIRAGTLIVVTHRRETDVPVACPPLYFRARMWRDRAACMSFAARDDLFLSGFFAGFPGGLPPRARRLLYGVGVARWLPVVRVHPLRSANVARLGELLRAHAGEPLAELLSPDHVAPFSGRAAVCGLAPPVRAGDVLRGEYADLLWRAVTPSDAAGARGGPFWSRRAAQAAGDFRALVELVRSGGILLVFPEGTPSHTGEIGQVQRGITALVRRAAPSELLPVALAYDPLVRGRIRITVAIGEAAEPPAEAIDDTVRALLRRTMPLTCGQVVADAVASGRARDVARLVDAAVEAAWSEGRPMEPDLASPARRRARVEEALRVARARPADVSFLAREYRSARDLPER